MYDENYSIYKYGKLIHELLDNELRHLKVRDGQLTTSCPFHDDHKPSFGINLETGLYNCFTCSAKGNIVQFVSNMKEITILESIEYLRTRGYDIENNNSGGYYTLEDYAKEKHLDIDFLSKILHLETAPTGKSIRIPYLDQENNQIAVRYRNHPNSSNRFYWGKGSKSHLYGLQFLDKFPSEYVILVEGESDCQCAWYNQIWTIGVPGAKNFKKEYAELFKRFNKIYIHQEKYNSGLEFVKKICQCLPFDNLYIIRACDIDDECDDLADLHSKGKLNKADLLKVEQKVPTLYLDEIHKETENSQHVEIAQKVLEELNIRFFNGNFYVYDNGVYVEGLSKIEQCILSIDKNIKKNIRNEILDYLRITNGVKIVNIDTNLINFKNGIYHIDTNTLEAHTPDIFTLCQINACYLTDEELESLKENNIHIYVDKFFNDISCRHIDRCNTLQEYIGYSMTYSAKLQKCLFLLGETADNGKSTFNELIIILFNNDNCCSISIEEFSQRFFGAELQNKLLNVVHEVEDIQLKDLAKFKTVISGNELSVEQKYKDRYKLKPFTHHIFAMNNLPQLNNGGDQGYFRRIQIVPFEAKFSDEEKEQFDFDKLITSSSLDYLANISLRKYLAMMQKHNRQFSNYHESNEIIDGYKLEDNSAMIFLNDIISYANIIDDNNKIKIKELYDLYTAWCQNNKFTSMPRKAFQNIALGCGKFKKAKVKDGYPCFQYIGEMPLTRQSSNPYDYNSRPSNTYDSSRRRWATF